MTTRDNEHHSHPKLDSLSGTRLVLALLSLRGVGRVVCNKLIQLGHNLGEIRQYPREQIGHRLAGLPKGAEIVSLLFDDGALEEATTKADDALRTHGEKRIAVITPLSDTYPTRLHALTERDRPAVLFAYGDPDALSGRSVAFFGRPPVDNDVFDHCQALVERIAEAGLITVLAGESGFCVALAKRAMSRGGRTILVLSSGLDAVPKEMRQTASLTARQGGAVVTPFPLGHGPFQHDRAEGARLMASLARVSVIASGTPAASHLAAAEWASKHDRGVFTFSRIESLPNAHILEDPVDDEWLLAATDAR